ncbi:hypothetical protein SAMN04488112_1254 [Melghirimyces thermohalophilus]|uniref:Pre-toxin TG domain-containing protein n=1 Tax=Melghirimyces thermohalophilus TaxID=1236220 RepID=A0A1G6R0G4_9BACL|nr:pre-toxin TG domain-containing protein [Melghirimyces thermohalophilus]SDC97487.1 hypothetical protein SAMN04488112_1254 [Melghirimyces thermohalophilus]
MAAAFQLKGEAPPDSPQAQPSDQPANQTSDQKTPAEAPPAAPKPEEKSTGEKVVNGVLDFVGYHDAKAAITGVDENGNKVGVGERIFRGALVLPIAKPVKGVKMVAKYGDDVLAAGKKKFDDFARKGKKTACACPRGWDMPKGGGAIDGREYSEHALERMAPDTIEVRAKLERRAVEKGLKPGTKEFKNYVDPRGIPPSVVEDTIKNVKPVTGNRPKTLKYDGENATVITNTGGKVITVIPK